MFSPVQQWGQVTMEISDTINRFGMLHVYPALPPKLSLARFQTNRLSDTFPHENGSLMKHLSTVSDPSRRSLGEISQKQASRANSTTPVPVTFNLL